MRGEGKIFAAMPPEPYPPFFLSREAATSEPARPEPVLGWQPAPAPGERERWAALSPAAARIGRCGGISTVFHALALAAVLLWAEYLVPPEPIAIGGAVAMVFAPNEPAAPHPALPPAVPTPPAAAPMPVAAPPPDAANTQTETAALAPPMPPPEPAITAAQEPPPARPAPTPERVQAMAPPEAPAKPAPRPHQAHAPPTQMAKAAEREQASASAASSSSSAPPAPSGPTLATAALVPPHPLAAAEGNHAPIYPVLSLRRREQGRVVLLVNVTADGRADTVQVATSSGFSALDRAAIDAVQQWRFVPATRGGTPVPATAEVPLNFTISH